MLMELYVKNESLKDSSEAEVKQWWANNYTYSHQSGQLYNHV